MEPQKLNQKPTNFVTSFSQTSFDEDALSLVEGKSIEAGVSPAKYSNAARAAASVEDRIPGNWGQDIDAFRSGRVRQIIRIGSQD